MQPLLVGISMHGLTYVSSLTMQQQKGFAFCLHILQQAHNCKLIGISQHGRALYQKQRFIGALHACAISTEGLLPNLRGRGIFFETGSLYIKCISGSWLLEILSLSSFLFFSVHKRYGQYLCKLQQRT